MSDPVIALALLAALAIGPASLELPDNPCDLIDRVDLAVVGQLVVQPGRRVPGKMEAGPGSICVFQTGPEFGEIVVGVLPRAQRRGAKYLEARDAYFRTYPGSGRSVPGVGQDAWLGGGTSLHVLIRDDDFFTLTTQYYQPESGELLAKIAKFVLSKFDGRESDRNGASGAARAEWREPGHRAAPATDQKAAQRAAVTQTRGRVPGAILERQESSHAERVQDRSQ